MLSDKKGNSTEKKVLYLIAIMLRLLDQMNLRVSPTSMEPN